MSRLRGERPLFFLAVLTLLLLRDHTGLYRISLLCCLLHEAGHLAVFLGQSRRLPRLRCSLWGICLEWRDARLTARQRFWLAAGGPLANLVCFAAAWFWMQHRASYWGWYFAGSSLLTASYNLLPVLPLDGGQMLAAWREERSLRG